MRTQSLTWSYSESCADIGILVLCIFSVANPLIAQVAFFFFPYEIAGMNVMQWFQGLFFPFILITLPKLSKQNVEFSNIFSRLLWIYVITLSVLHLRVFSAGRIPNDMISTERMIYFKIIFALLLWYYTACLAQSCESAQRLLRSILWGALIIAGWILVCYFLGMGSSNYASEGIKATAGSEGISGKAMAGFLLPSAVGAMFLALKEHSYGWAAGASLLIIAVFVTFDRSAQVAFIMVLLWVTLWWLCLARPRPSLKIALLFLCIIIVLGAAYFAYQGSEEMITRWTRDFDRGEIGSGRGTFYMTACAWFWKDSSMMDFFFGVGYGSIYDLMYSQSGIFRHTHSDLFDMLLIGGIVGLILYLILFYTIISLGIDLPVGSTEFGVLGALLISFGVMSLCTGLMAFPHTMYAFGAQCICIRVLASQDKLNYVSSFSVNQHQSYFTPIYIERGVSPLLNYTQKYGSKTIQ